MNHKPCTALFGILVLLMALGRASDLCVSGCVPLLLAGVYTLSRRV